MDTRFYQSPHLDIERMAHDLESAFLAQGYQVQHFGNREHTTIQFRKGSDLEALIGMQAALTLTLQKQPDGVVALIGQQQWVDKAAAGALGILFLWPLALTAGAGIIRQATLEGQLFNTLDAIVRQQAGNVYAGPVPPEMQSRMQQDPSFYQPNPGYGPTPNTAGVQCPGCHAFNEPDDSFCSHCGTSLTARKHCPQCNAEVKANATFCPKCGAALSEQHV